MHTWSRLFHFICLIFIYSPLSMLVFFLTINKQKTKPKQLLSFRVIVLLQTSLTFFFFLWEFFVFVFLTRMHPCMFYHCYKGFRCCILITSPPPWYTSWQNSQNAWNMSMEGENSLCQSKSKWNCVKTWIKLAFFFQFEIAKL